MRNKSVLNSLSSALACGALLTGILCGSASATFVWSPEQGRFINPAAMPKETPEAQIQYAEELLRQKDYGKSREEFERFFRFFGDSELAPQAYLGIAKSYDEEGAYKKAFSEYGKLVTDQKHSEIARAALGREYAIADEMYERGVATKDGFNPFGNTGFERAEYCYTQITNQLPLLPEAVKAYYQTAMIHFYEERYIEASEEFKLVWEQFRNSEWAQKSFLGMAECDYKAVLPPMFDPSPAQRALERYRTYSSAFNTGEQAVPVDDRVKKLQNVLAEHAFNVAQFYERRGKAAAARLYYADISKTYPETDWAAKASQRLLALP